MNPAEAWARYEAENTRAAHIYRAERERAEGWCAACGTRRRDGHSAQCNRCRKEKK